LLIKQSNTLERGCGRDCQKKEEQKKNLTGDEKIIADARDCLKSCIDAEEDERKKMADDLRFAALDQWPAEIRKDREGDVENGPRPCLTIDKLNQYIVQVVNDVRQGRPGINVARRTITPMLRRRES
jgi:hypothetical protein